jgi:topoisomerase-4 subunit A
MKHLSGGKGVQIMGLREGERLRDAIALRGTQVEVRGTHRNREKTLLSEERHLSQRARRGAPIGPLQAPRLQEPPAPAAD